MHNEAILVTVVSSVLLWDTVDSFLPLLWSCKLAWSAGSLLVSKAAAMGNCLHCARGRGLSWEVSLFLELKMTQEEGFRR